MAEQTHNQALEQYEAKSNKYIAKANSFNIKTEDDVYDASEFLKTVKETIKNIENKRLEYTKPLRDHVNKINGDFKRIMQPLEQAENTLKRNILAWQRSEREKIAKEEARRRKIQESHEKRGHDVKAPVEMYRPLKTIGNSQMRKVTRYEVVDLNKVPRQYLQLNPGAVQAAIRGGVKEVPGLRIYEDEVIAVS